MLRSGRARWRRSPVTVLAGAVPVRRSASTFVGGSTGWTTLTIGTPSGAVHNDVPVAGIGWRGDHTSASPGAPAGWTLVQRNGDGEIGQFVHTRIVTASEPTSHAWTGRDANKAGSIAVFTIAVFTIAVFTGVDATAPVDVSAGQVNPSASRITAPAVTTTRANVLLVGVFGVVGRTALSAPTGMGEIWRGTPTGVGAASFQMSTSAADEARPTVGATGTRTATTQGSGRSIGQLVALQPPARPHATTTWTPSSSAWATGQVFRLGTGGTVQRQATLAAAVVSFTARSC